MTPAPVAAGKNLRSAMVREKGDQFKKKRIFNFLKRHRLAVIATVNQKNNPESAVLEFSQKDNLEIIFDTLMSSRKFNNLQSHQRVALVIGWDNNITVQYEGNAHELWSNELESCKKIFFAKLPHAKKWEKNPDIRFFKCSPKWIRYSDLNKDPWEIFEINFS